jgi:hypothetical protein
MSRSMGFPISTSRAVRLAAIAAAPLVLRASGFA